MTDLLTLIGTATSAIVITLVVVIHLITAVLALTVLF